MAKRTSQRRRAGQITAAFMSFVFGSGSAATPPRGDAPARREELHPAYEALASKLG